MIRRQIRRRNDEGRVCLLQLGGDLELAWSYPAATMRTRSKRIIRAVLNEIIARIEDGFVLKRPPRRLFLASAW
jgi:hypothetical protein